MPAARAPRRLTKEARYQQLIELAMPVVAEQGFGEFSLEEIAERADVTRNNLYRYFPRGRPDIVAAVVREAGRQLTTGWVTDGFLSREQRLEANMERIGAHAFGPSTAWRIHRQARAADKPEITEIVSDYLDTIVSYVALNNLGTADPSLRVRLTILATIAFGETLIDEARGSDVGDDELARIMLDTLVAALRSAQAVS
jgi:AcrR family transcriptional regulator